MKRKTSKKLELNRETLRRLSPEQLEQVVGGETSRLPNECQTDSCVTCQVGSACPCPLPKTEN